MIIYILFFILFLLIIWLFIYSSILRKKIEASQDSISIETVVHELRTPLTGLRWIFNSLTELKLGDSLDDEKIFMIKEGKGKVEYTIELVNDALGALNVSSNAVPYNFQKVDITSIVEAVVEENKTGAEEKSIKLSTMRLSPIEPFMLDRIKITLALRNLISNAVKYTSSGGKIIVSLDTKDKKCLVGITDTGIGIPSEDLGRIFSKFFRARNVSDISGSGLGLFIVKKIVDGHNGQIEIQSKEGEGTRISLALPIRT